MQVINKPMQGSSTPSLINRLRERSGISPWNGYANPTIAKKPRKQAISGRFWAGRTYKGRIKDDHKIENCTTSLIRVAAA